MSDSIKQWNVTRQSRTVELTNLAVIRSGDNNPIAYVGDLSCLDLLAAAPEMLEAFEKIKGLSAGFDDEGSTGPKPPLSWESVARVAIDLSVSAIAKATGEEVDSE